MTDTLFKLRILRVMLGGAYTEWRDTIANRDLDGLYCCDGRECCCGGSTVREMWAYTDEPTA